MLFLTVVFFSNDFNLLDIEKTALIVSLGIDYDENEYEVTAQIAIPQATDYASQNNDAIISAKGLTVADAITNIGINTGWFPKLSFCNLIIIGEDAEETTLISQIEYTLRSNKILDSAIITCCEGKAKELLLKTTPLDAISSLALQKILVKKVDKTDAVIAKDIKTFAIEYAMPSNLSLMPIVKTVETDDKSQEGSSAVANIGGEKGGKEDKPVVFDATNTAIFSGGKIVGKLTQTQTLIYKLLTSKVDEAYVRLSKEDGGNADTLFTIHGNKNGIKLRRSQSEFTLELKTHIKIKTVDRKVEKLNTDILEIEDTNASVMQSLKKYLQDEVISLINL